MIEGANAKFIVLCQLAGPDDIALIKLKEGVALVPGRIVPVSETLTTSIVESFIIIWHLKPPTIRMKASHNL